MRTLMIAIALTACSTQTTADPDADPAAAAPPTTTALVACTRYGELECAARAACGDTEPDVCAAKWADICATVGNNTVPTYLFDGCALALAAHGCDGSYPRFCPQAQACLAYFGGLDD